jgi:hypothetical protein
MLPPREFRIDEESTVESTVEITVGMMMFDRPVLGIFDDGRGFSQLLFTSSWGSSQLLFTSLWASA